MKRIQLTLVVLLVLSVAAFAAAQNADKNSAGPTRNDYRLKIVQPLEGAKITGNTFDVVVDTTIPAERDTKADVNSMPRPLVDVFLDELYQDTMRSGSNVVNLRNVTPGPHTVTILAKNMSGEVIDRKIISVIAVPPPAPEPVVAEAPVPPPAPAPAYAPPAPAPPAEAVAQEIPKTGTSDPLLLVMGLVLLLGGIAIRRF